MVRIPRWLSDEWEDNEKYPGGSLVAAVHLQEEGGEQTLQVHPPPKRRQKTTPHILSTSLSTSTSSMTADGKKKENPAPPIPKSFKITQKPARKRLAVKHGELEEKSEIDKLVVFTEKPPFLVNHEVEAMHDKNCKMERGTVVHVTNDRKYTVQFAKDGYKREGMLARDIRSRSRGESDAFTAKAGF